MRPKDVAGTVLAITLLGAGLRFWRIGHQSFWLDESFTVALVRQPFGDMISSVPDTESTPHLYYILAWGWGQLFGTDEAGLRTLSALFGTITIPIAFLAAREWFGYRTGLIAAALVAVNPYFWWYSQEARAYALLVLLATLTLWLLACALKRERRGRWVALWALASVLALCTHYFAGFLLIPEAVWLVWGTRSWKAVAAVAAVLAAAGGLTPLALEQRSTGHTLFIGDLSLADRVWELPKKLVTGELGSPVHGIGIAAGVLVVLGVLGIPLLTREHRRAAFGLLAVTVVAAVLPILLAAAGTDYFLPRNLIALYVPFILALAAGFAGRRRARLRLAAAVTLCVLCTFVVVWTIYDPSVQRDDWRGAARALGPAPNGDRVIVLTPDPARRPLRLYAGSLPRIDPRGPAPTVIEVVSIGNARPPDFPEPQPPAAGFEIVERKKTDSYELIRWRAPAAPVPILLPALEGARLGSKVPAILIQRARTP